MQSVDTRLLPRAIFSLATGRLDYESFDFERESSDASSMMASYLASDLILRSMKPHEVGLQSDLLSSHT